MDRSVGRLKRESPEAARPMLFAERGQVSFGPKVNSFQQLYTDFNDGHKNAPKPSPSAEFQNENYVLPFDRAMRKIFESGFIARSIVRSTHFCD